MIKKLRINESRSKTVGEFLEDMIERGKIDEKQIVVIHDKNNNIMWLGKAGFAPVFMDHVPYKSSGYDNDHPHELWINARSYTRNFGENTSVRKLKTNESKERDTIILCDDCIAAIKSRGERVHILDEDIPEDLLREPTDEEIDEYGFYDYDLITNCEWCDDLFSEDYLKVCSF